MTAKRDIRDFLAINHRPHLSECWALKKDVSLVAIVINIEQKNQWVKIPISIHRISCAEWMTIHRFVTSQAMRMCPMSTKRWDILLSLSPLHIQTKILMPPDCIQRATFLWMQTLQTPMTKTKLLGCNTIETFIPLLQHQVSIFVWIYATISLHLNTHSVHRL